MQFSWTNIKRNSRVQWFIIRRAVGLCTQHTNVYEPCYILITSKTRSSPESFFPLQRPPTPKKGQKVTLLFASGFNLSSSQRISSCNIWVHCLLHSKFQVPEGISKFGEGLWLVGGSALTRVWNRNRKSQVSVNSIFFHQYLLVFPKGGTKTKVSRLHTSCHYAHYLIHCTSSSSQEVQVSHKQDSFHIKW